MEEYIIEYTNKRTMRVKLIFNPGSGSNDKSPVQLINVISEMQNWKLMPEPFLIEPNCKLEKEIEDALADGIRMIAVCGGDGTVSSVSRALLGTTARLGIIPTGTQNNIAKSLGIPKDIPEAIALLRTGQPNKIDMGMSICNTISTPFIELCSIGLFSSLFAAGDDIQHGKITKIGDFLATLTTTPPSEIHLLLDDNREIIEVGHVVLISNMPFVGLHFQVGKKDAFQDGFLDVLFSSDLSKLDLISHAFKGQGMIKNEDPRIRHFRVRKIQINTTPPMPVMADGVTVGEGSVLIEVKRRALTVMTKVKTSNLSAESGEMIEK